MTQKVLHVGNSTAVTLPKPSLNELGIAIGDTVRVDIDKKRRTVMIQPDIDIDPELVAWTDQFIEKYGHALKALS